MKMKNVEKQKTKNESQNYLDSSSTNLHLLTRIEIFTKANTKKQNTIDKPLRKLRKSFLKNPNLKIKL